jgi:hypothetical protein
MTLVGTKRQLDDENDEKDDTLKKSNKKKKKYMYLLKGELYTLFFDKGDTPSVCMLKGMQTAYIANTVPPCFVTTSGYTKDHSLRKIAFQCLRTNYNKLCVVQKLFRRIAGTHSPYQQLLGHLPKEGIDKTVVIIRRLLAMAQMDNLDLSMCMGAHVVAIDETKRRRSHRWIKDNWSAIRALESKHGSKLPKTAPILDDIQAYQTCLRRILAEQTGMGFETVGRKNSKPWTHRLTFGSFWRQLGINVGEYATWLVDPSAKDFGMCEVHTTQCEVCCCTAADGPEVDCVMQNGLWRCTVQGSVYTEIHRNLTEPIDVGSLKRFAETAAKRNANFVSDLAL